RPPAARPLPYTTLFRSQTPYACRTPPGLRPITSIAVESASAATAVRVTTEACWSARAGWPVPGSMTWPATSDPYRTIDSVLAARSEEHTSEVQSLAYLV